VVELGDEVSLVHVSTALGFVELTALIEVSDIIKFIHGQAPNVNRSFLARPTDNKNWTTDYQLPECPFA
jgi:hypothetical protein